MKFYHRIPLFLFNIFYPYKIHGKENIPEGSAVMVCNHFRGIDCGFVADAYHTDIYFLAKKEIFKNKLFGKIVKSFGAIPIDREKPDLKSLMQAITVLKQGHKLVVFPEGSRNKSGTDQLQEIKSGSGVFAVKAKCPIVPMMLLKKPRFLRRTHLIIGKPFELTEYYGKKLTDQDTADIDKIIYDKMVEQHVILKEKLAKKSKKEKAKK